MQIVQSFPPNIDKIKAAFNVPPNTVFTYSPHVYSPLSKDLPTHLVIHEQTHLTQQHDDPEAWWDRYLQDADFRFDQELEAYRNQYRYMQRNIKNYHRLQSELDLLAKDLSSAMYGSIISLFHARELIMNV